MKASRRDQGFWGDGSRNSIAAPTIGWDKGR
jgi:hypothetical protein